MAFYAASSFLRPPYSRYHVIYTFLPYLTDPLSVILLATYLYNRIIIFFRGNSIQKYIYKYIYNNIYE